MSSVHPTRLCCHSSLAPQRVTYATYFGPFSAGFISALPLPQGGTIRGGADRPWTASSWLCYANMRLSPVLGSPPFSHSGVSGRSHAREDCGEVMVGCPGPLDRTRHKGLMWTAARRSTAPAPLSLI
jgi:hypothetical protein